MALAAAAAWAMRVKHVEPLAETRTKGVLSLDVVLRRSSGEIIRPAQGEIVFPGDALRFEVNTAVAGFVAVLGLDAGGAATIYAPASGPMIRLDAGAPTVLPGSIVADSTLGHERIVAVLCAEPRPLDELRQAALRGLSHAGGDPQGVKDLGISCNEAWFLVHKRDRL